VALTDTASTLATWSAHYATGRGGRVWPCEELVRAVARRGGRLGTVLEAGCGTGANLWFLAEHADRVIGVDIEPGALVEALATCRRTVTAQQRVRRVQGEIGRLPVADRSVDAVVDVMTSQHVRWEDHPALFEEYRRVLRPGGWLFLYHLGSGTTRAGGVGRDSWMDTRAALFPEAGRVCLPWPEMLELVLREAGFDVGESRRMTRTYPGGLVADYIVAEGERT
jgi:SAM-dependent methyltransferase